MKISEYMGFVRKTDKLPKDKLTPVLFGLYGEIGELLTIEKKKHREDLTNLQGVTDELGDIFWYLCCLINRLELKIEDIFTRLSDNQKPDIDTFTDASNLPRVISSVLSNHNNSSDSLLVQLGKHGGEFLDESCLQKDKEKKIASFLKYFFALIISYIISYKEEISPSSIFENNKKKISGRFLPFDKDTLPDFDKDFPYDFERLPEEFQIEFVQKPQGLIALRWNGVFVGDPLSDSIQGSDGYKFHDVFHLSYASILHWSPIFRALIKHKRKSDSQTDENQDGGRARVVEEGVSAWIFNVAKENKFFEGKTSLPFDTLKHVEQMVKGFEVEKCPLSLWEEAILKGYKVFRQVKQNKGGVVIGNRKERTIDYKKSL